MRRISHFLAGFTLCAAMSIILSCVKQDPEPLYPLEPQGQEPQAETGTPGEQETPSVQDPVTLSLSLPEDFSVLSYKGQPFLLEFTVNGAAGRDDVTISAAPSDGFNDFRLEVAPEGGSAVLAFTLVSDAASFTVTVSGPDSTISRNTAVSSYYARLTGIQEGDIVEDEGSGREIHFDLETNIPEANGVLSVGTEADWITISQDGNEYIATLASNYTGDVRDAKIVLSDRNGFLPTESFIIHQDWQLFTPVGEYVVFVDKAFKAACLDVSDTDGDRQVSFTEAAAVKELYVRDRRITDLTGLEKFVNLEYFEAQDNDIRNADMLANLHLLHWLDLTGNMNLESFDVTGCSVYFERCWYEVTPQLRYKTFMRQLNITFDCDTYCEHADIIFDERTSENYSMQHDLTLLHQHSIGDGKKVIVLTGLGFIDIDHFDGSFDRVMNDALKFFMETWPKYKEHYEEFDIYIMRHIIHTRDEYVYPSSLFGTDEAKVIAKQWSKEREFLIEDSYNLISPENDKKVLTLSIDIHPNVRIVPIMGTTLCLTNWDKNYKNINHYYFQCNVSPALDLDMLKVFSSRNTSLRYNILYTSINSTEQFEKEFFGFFNF